MSRTTTAATLATLAALSVAQASNTMSLHARIKSPSLEPLTDMSTGLPTTSTLLNSSMVTRHMTSRDQPQSRSASPNAGMDQDRDAEGSPPLDDDSGERGSKRRRSTRGPGARSVANMTPEQLTRKRAMDRHAQRAIRERTRAQIDRLEARVRELEAMQPYQDMQRALNALKAVQAENAELRSRVAGVVSLLQPLMVDAAPAGSVAMSASSVAALAAASSPATQAAVANMIAGSGNSGQLSPQSATPSAVSLLLDPSAHTWSVPARQYEPPSPTLAASVNQPSAQAIIMGSQLM